MVNPVGLRGVYVEGVYNRRRKISLGHVIGVAPLSERHVPFLQFQPDKGGTRTLSLSSYEANRLYLFVPDTAKVPTAVRAVVEGTSSRLVYGISCGKLYGYRLLSEDFREVIFERASVETSEFWFSDGKWRTGKPSLEEGHTALRAGNTEYEVPDDVEEYE